MTAPQHQPPAHWMTHSDVVFTAAEVDLAIARMASQLQQCITADDIILLCVMRGGLFLAGQLMGRLPFAMRIDYAQANRYHGTSGQEIVWARQPELDLTGQTVLIVDDILDEGITLAEVVRFCQQAGAATVMTAVLTEKDNGLDKPLKADVVGLVVPDRYVFGCGMDVYGWWRNLPEIRALQPAA